MFVCVVCQGILVWFCVVFVVFSFFVHFVHTTRYWGRVFKVCGLYFFDFSSKVPKFRALEKQDSPSSLLFPSCFSVFCCVFPPKNRSIFVFSHTIQTNHRGLRLVGLNLKGVKNTASDCRETVKRAVRNHLRGKIADRRGLGRSGVHGAPGRLRRQLV